MAKRFNLESTRDIRLALSIIIESAAISAGWQSFFLIALVIKSPVRAFLTPTVCFSFFSYMIKS